MTQWLRKHIATERDLSSVAKTYVGQSSTRDTTNLRKQIQEAKVVNTEQRFYRNFALGF